MANNDWAKTTLGEFVTLQRGHDLPEKVRVPGNVPVMGSFGITGWHNQSKASGPGVTVGRSGASFGVVNYSPVDFWPLNTALYVIDFHGNDERYANYFLQQFDFKRYNSGSAQPSLNRNHIHPIPVTVPPLPEQKAIAHILGTLDDKIELNRRMNETLESMARALFKSWFVDFDPVRAKAEGRQPTGLSPEIAALFPDRFEESELGEIPMDWTPGTLSDLSVLNAQTWTKQTLPAELSYVDLSNTKDGIIETTSQYSKEEAPSRARRRLFVGDTIFGTVRPGNRSFALVFSEGLTGSTGFAVLSPKKREHREFVYLAATNDMNVADLANLADGGAYPAVRPEVVASSPVTTPHSDVLCVFSRITSPLMDRLGCNLFENKYLAMIRDTMLPHLMSGSADMNAIVAEQHVEVLP